MEANIVDDGVPIAYNSDHRHLLEEEYVVFDVETTGLSAVYNTVIELAAVKIKNGEIVDTYESFADPKEPISATIIELTGITDDMVQGAPDPLEVLKQFREFAGEATIVAHNASFDIGFLNVGYKKLGLLLFKSKTQLLIRLNSDDFLSAYEKPSSKHFVKSLILNLSAPPSDLRCGDNRLFA